MEVFAQLAAGSPDIVDVSPQGLYAKLAGWVEGAYRLLPNFAVAIVVFILFWLVGIGLKRSVIAWANRSDRSNLGAVLGSFVKAAVIVFGFFIGLTIILPSLNPADLIAGLGIGSVAIGFAFKDILQNWLAGMLILIRQPFRPGDQIVVSGYEGTVDHIETRVTAIRTYDHRLALIPNSDVYTNAVIVNTAFDKRRSEYEVGIGYGDDLHAGKAVVLRAAASVEDVLADPAPDVLLVDLAASWVTIRVRWWTTSPRSDVLKVKSDVIAAIKLALDEAGIDMPYDTQVQLFHDQTEEVDGDRTAQREGWPAGDRSPRSRRVVDQDKREAAKEDE